MHAYSYLVYFQCLSSLLVIIIWHAMASFFLIWSRTMELRNAAYTRLQLFCHLSLFSRKVIFYCEIWIDNSFNFISPARRTKEKFCRQMPRSGKQPLRSQITRACWLVYVVSRHLRLYFFAIYCLRSSTLSQHTDIISALLCVNSLYLCLECVKTHS